MLVLRPDVHVERDYVVAETQTGAHSETGRHTDGKTNRQTDRHVINDQQYYVYDRGLVSY